MLQTPEKLDKKPETEKEIGRERAAAEWLCGGSKDVSEGAKAVRDAVKGNPALCRRMRAARRLSLYGGPQADDDFNAVLCVLRNTLECKAATEALLAHFGGDKPHTGAQSIHVNIPMAYQSELCDHRTLRAPLRPPFLLKPSSCDLHA